MSFKYNPLTGKFDLVSKGGVAATDEKVFTAVDEILIKEDSELFLEQDAEAFIKDADLGNVQKIISQVTVRANGELLIEANSTVEVVNE